MNKHLLIIGIILLGVSGFGFTFRKFIDDNTTIEWPEAPVTFERKTITILNKIPQGNENLDRTKIENATPLDYIRNVHNLNDWDYDENTVKAMLYVMQRIVNAPNWFRIVKEKSKKLSGIYSNKVDVQLFKDARFILEKDGLEMQEKTVHITHETAGRYMNAIYGMQFYNFNLNILNMTF